MDRQQHRAKLRRRQINLCGQVQPSGFSGLLLHQNGDVLIEQVDDQHHGADKEPVQQVVPNQRHRIQVIDGVDGGSVEGQVDQHGDQKEGKGFVQCGVLPPGGEVDEGHKGQNQK